jgi:hypothetical protein
MAILAVGNEPESFNNHFTGNTQTTAKDRGQRGGVAGDTDGTTRWELNITSSSEVWIRFWCFYSSNNTSTTNYFFDLFNSTNSRSVLQWLNVSTGRVNTRFRYLSTAPSTYTTIADVELPLSQTPGNEFVIYFKRGSSGVLKIWVNGSLIYSFTGNYASVDTTFDRFRWYSPSTGANWGGGFILADENLVGYEMDHLSPSGAGNYSGWTGSAANLADATGAPAVNTGTDINTNATAQRSTFAYDDMLTLSDGREIAVVSVASRGILEAGSTPTTCDLVSRFSGTDYTHGSFGFGASASNNNQLFTTDPAGGAWSESDVNGIEYGALSG